MRLISKKAILDFITRYPETEQSLLTWHKEVKNMKWNAPADIKSKYPSASILNNNRVVFNLKGNKYRLIVRVNYVAKIVWIRFIGTHAQYDKIDANNI